MGPAFRLRPSVLELESAPDVPSLLAALGDRAGVVALDSAAGEPCRTSLVAFDPLAVPDGVRSLDDLRAFCARLEPDGGDEVPGPFAGGFVGALSYDLGAAGERPQAVAPEPFGQPPVVGGLYCDFVVRDERARRAWLVLGEDPGDARAAVAERAASLRAALARPRARGALRASDLARHVTPAEHVRRVERVRADIARGDVYQVNLAHRLSARLSGSPLDLYLRLREVNAAPYMGWCRFAQGALASASPELLLEYDGHTARTRPIKGTRPRDADPERDACLGRELLESAKDRAELAMIVDLERNDLGRVAERGGVWVEDWPRLASYARVHHLLADVVARPRAGVDAIDLLAALFPGGSVTGAPKLAAMRVIAELEGHGRGFFCGALGCLDVRGRALFNLLIRTHLWRPSGPGEGEVGFQVGGGITWSSDALAEERETLDKAAGLLAALGLERTCAP
ncbi:MAG TPA: anthranilate synthase component I family protein [Planctomycetota bacterium]|nr:anthranilate synthase component I family protein [Planctomycetota bacterium]